MSYNNLHSGAIGNDNGYHWPYLSFKNCLSLLGIHYYLKEHPKLSSCEEKDFFRDCTPRI